MTLRSGRRGSRTSSRRSRACSARWSRARSYLKALLGTVERRNTRQISAYTSRSNSEETAIAARKTAAPRPAKTPAAPAEPPKCGPCKGTGQVAVPVRVGRSHRQVGVSLRN
jgi:hypothetical protein